MDLVKFFHMNGGVGEASYSSNSGLQRMGIMKTRRIIEEAISNLCQSNIKHPKTLVMADLGCSLGPNTLLVGSMVINAVAKTSQEMGVNPPEVQINLNDLPTNDFNTIFCALQEHEKKLNTEKITDVHSSPSCYFTGVPGSYFGRLFPAKSLNFIHSSNSLHWLSQLPKLREINKGNIYLASTTPESVSKAYYEQFQADFLQFLRCRSEELMVGGRMVLTLAGRTTEDPRSEGSYYIWRPLATALQEMVSEGLVDEAKFDTFNLPWFTASPTEIMKLVEIEGSFEINHIEIFDVNWEAWKTKKYDNDNDASTDDNGVGHAVAKSVRAAIETLVANHFGEAIVDDVFMRYAKFLTSRKSKKEDEVVVSVTLFDSKRVIYVISLNKKEQMLWCGYK